MLTLLRKSRVPVNGCLSLRGIDRDNLKNQAFNSYVDKIGVRKVWPEIILYRATGQSSTYFLSGQRLRHDDENENKTMDTLEVAFMGWVRLASEGRLSQIEKRVGAPDGKDQFNSHAERFKAFLEFYEQKYKFEKWDYPQMCKVCFDIHQLVLRFDGEESSPMLPPGKLSQLL